MDLQNMSVEDALTHICILADYAAEESESEAIRDSLKRMRYSMADLLGNVLANQRIADARARMAKEPEPEPAPAPPAPKQTRRARLTPVADIPETVDDASEALRDVLADAIEADIAGDDPGTIAEKETGLKQKVFHATPSAPAFKTPPPMGKINDPEKFVALVDAGFSKKDLATEFGCDARVIEEYCRVMRIKLHPGKRKSTVKALENLSGNL